MYQAVRAAIAAEQKGVKQRTGGDEVSDNGFSVIGKPIAMVDAAGKTTGAGKYTDDLSLPGMLVGKILHSPYPHARIKRIDTSRAKALDGVVAVVTGEDAPNPLRHSSRRSRRDGVGGR